MDNLDRSPPSNSDNPGLCPHAWSTDPLRLHLVEWNGNNIPDDHPKVHKDDNDDESNESDGLDEDDDNSSITLDLDYQEEIIETEEVSTSITSPGEIEFLDMSTDTLMENGDGFSDQDSDESLMGLAIKPVTAEVQVETGEDTENKLKCPVRCSRRSESSTKSSPQKLFTRKVPAIPTNLWAKDPLPDGWKLIHHNCGIPMYVQKETNTITFSRPYVFSRSAPIKTHKIPLGSIPCLEYAKIQAKIAENGDNAVSKSNTEKNGAEGEENGVKNPEGEENGVKNPEGEENGVKNPEGEENGVKNPEESCNEMKNPEESCNEMNPVFHDSQVIYVDNNELEEYLQKRFKFSTSMQPKFQSWNEHRKFVRSKRKRKHNNKNAAAVENGEHNEESTNGEKKKKLDDEVQSNVINMLIRKERTKDGKARNLSFNVQTKSPICILHEYCQNALKAKPEYKFTRKETNTDPFHSTVSIEGKEYASASAINKKAAKNQSALDSMEILAPGFKVNYEKALGNQSNDFLSNLEILDDRVSIFCLKSGGYFPERLLQECINRNKGVADHQSDFFTNMGKNNVIHYTLKYGRHCVTGTAKNKRMARQESAQRMLARLHPEMKKWGEVIHRYGVTVSEKKNQRRTEEQEIFELKQRDRDARLKQTADRMAPPFQQQQHDTWERREEQEEAEASGVVEKLKKEMLSLRKKRLTEEERRAAAAGDDSGSKLCCRCHTHLDSIPIEDVPPTKRMLLGGVNL